MRLQIDGLVAKMQLEHERQMEETSIYLAILRTEIGSDQGDLLGWNGIHPAVQASGRKIVPVAPEREGIETADPVAIPLAHGGTVDLPKKCLQNRETGNGILAKSVKIVSPAQLPLFRQKQNQPRSASSESPFGAS